MKIYVTKYWETRGIMKADGNVLDDWATIHNGGQFLKPDWHRTPEEALADALRRQIKLVATLRKRIRKIQAIKL